MFPLADFQREAWHRGEVRRREGKRKKREKVGRGGKRGGEEGEEGEKGGNRE